MFDSEPLIRFIRSGGPFWGFPGSITSFPLMKFKFLEYCLSGGDRVGICVKVGLWRFKTGRKDLSLFQIRGVLSYLPLTVPCALCAETIRLQIGECSDYIVPNIFDCCFTPIRHRFI